ncbi:Altered inheritance of mitochondria protein 6 -like protein [Ceratocystis lukuohia]|uniref:Altered inheritance of mitochondria protein 6 -like protein n=1 Tax=Ceratocystis lukuohia TaxID=2019550 RepID=A0ABR4MHA8_9PEZI
MAKSMNVLSSLIYLVVVEWTIPGASCAWFNSGQDYDLATVGVPLPCHSHNDYLRTRPLFDALEAGCTSVEADVWLRNNDLYISHKTPKTLEIPTFTELYVNPIFNILEDNINLAEGDIPVGVFSNFPNQELIVSLREWLWGNLLKAGVDYLNVDDLVGANRWLAKRKDRSNAMLEPQAQSLGSLRPEGSTVQPPPRQALELVAADQALRWHFPGQENGLKCGVEWWEELSLRNVGYRASDQMLHFLAVSVPKHTEAPDIKGLVYMSRMRRHTKPNDLILPTISPGFDGVVTFVTIEDQDTIAAI